MGSAGVAAFIGHFVYWVLIIWGVATESLSVRAFVVFLLLWLVPYVTLDFAPAAAPFFSPTSRFWTSCLCFCSSAGTYG